MLPEVHHTLLRIKPLCCALPLCQSMLHAPCCLATAYISTLDKEKQEAFLQGSRSSMKSIMNVYAHYLDGMRWMYVFLTKYPSYVCKAQRTVDAMNALLSCELCIFFSYDVQNIRRINRYEMRRLYRLTISYSMIKLIRDLVYCSSRHSGHCKNHSEAWHKYK